MRLLLTTDTMGGVWNFTETLAHGLLSEGHAVSLLSFGRPLSRSQSAAVKLLRGRFKASFSHATSAAPLEWMADNRRTWSEGSDVLLRTADAFDPDVVHANQMCFGELNAGLPVVVTVHSDVLSWAECALAPDGRERLRQTCSPAWLKTYVELVELGLRSANAVAAPTRWMAEAASRIYGLAGVPEVIANGLAPLPPLHVKRKLQAVTAGRMWDEAKGLDLLAEVRSPMPILVAGESREAASGAGIEMLGQIAHDDLLRLFAESSIYIASSVYEPFGLAPLEAAAAGCCVVARDIATLREVWGDAALYFSSARTLEDLLVSLAAKPMRLRGAQCRARERARHFSANRMTQGYLELYGRLLRQATPSLMPALAYA